MDFLITGLAIIGGYIINDFSHSTGIFKKKNPQNIQSPISLIPMQKNESEERIKKMEAFIEQQQRLTGTSFPTENPKIKNIIDKLEGILKKADTMKQENNKAVDDIITEYEKKLDDEIAKIGIAEYKEDQI